jgi:hypothetical protein
MNYLESITAWYAGLTTFKKVALWIAVGLFLFGFLVGLTN